MREALIWSSSRTLLYPQHLVFEPEVQPLIALMVRGFDVVLPLCWCPRVPDLVPSVINPFVVKVNQQVQTYVSNADDNQVPVSAPIAWGVICN